MSVRCSELERKSGCPMKPRPVACFVAASLRARESRRRAGALRRSFGIDSDGDARGLTSSETSRIEGFLRHAALHAERGNFDAVREAIADALAMVAKSRKSQGVQP